MSKSRIVVRESLIDGTKEIKIFAVDDGDVTGELVTEGVVR